MPRLRLSRNKGFSVGRGWRGKRNGRSERLSVLRQKASTRELIVCPLVLRTCFEMQGMTYSGGPRNRTDAGNTGKTPLPFESGAESGALSTDSTRFDADLQALIDAWPKLPANVKASILSMIQAVAPPARGGEGRHCGDGRGERPFPGHLASVLVDNTLDLARVWDSGDQYLHAAMSDAADAYCANSEDPLEK